MKSTRLDHVSVTVSNLERSVHFYHDLLGIAVLGTGEETGNAVASMSGDSAGSGFRYADLDLGQGQVLELLEYRTPPGRAGPPTVRTPGAGHFGILVPDLTETLSELATHGILPQGRPATLEEPSWWKGARVVYLRDPDGATVELVERPRPGKRDGAHPSDPR
ncbi:MAG TPA: VOC family protein [Thermoplasmata archaeon]|nr:VOC family protein [Thermoplasmata archaeon]